MNTIKHWLNTLPDPYKEQALKNTSKSRLDKTTSSLSVALTQAFIWSETPEGINYWNDVKFKAQKGTL